MSREAKQHLEAYLEWRRQIGGAFDLTPDSPMFLCQDPKHRRGERLGYKGLYQMVKKLGAIPLAVCSTTMLRKRCATIASVEDIRPHCFRHEFSTSITPKNLDPLYGKELMGIKSDKVYGRYTQGALFASGGIALTCRRFLRMKISSDKIANSSKSIISYLLIR